MTKQENWCAAFCAVIGFILGCIYGCYSGTTSDLHDCQIAHQVRFDKQVYYCAEIKL